jgi:hypothetical protein
MKFINFFQCLWVIFARLDPDQDPDSGSGTDPGTPLNPDPDPQHCFYSALVSMKIVIAIGYVADTNHLSNPLKELT